MGLFGEIDSGRIDDPESIDRAMNVFRELIITRGETHPREDPQNFPNAELFAADTAVSATDDPDAPPAPPVRRTQPWLNRGRSIWDRRGRTRSRDLAGLGLGHRAPSLP